MRRAIPFIAGLLGAGACAVAQNTGPSDAGADPFAVVARADQLAARPLWPGFEPGDIPVAVYDGNRTLLFRHPSPPEGFKALPDHAGILVYEGRHPAVTANSSAAIGGMSTATLMPGSKASSVVSRAGVLIHEKFHVFQRSHHPGWSANEVELFTYPVDRADLLALREMETEALRRALEGGDAKRTGCWARAAADLRRERFALIPAGAVAYERGTELNEGLATYVERLATGKWNDASLRSGFPPDAVRQKAYETGAAMGRLLDRLDPAWPQVLERSDSTPLDVLLDRAASVPGAVACAFTDAE
ncbi:MAG TPA: hypothetical protein VF035_03775, partial [Longimicrobiales bacterium]